MEPLTPEPKKTHVTVFQYLSYLVVGLAIAALLFISFQLLVPTKVLGLQRPLHVTPSRVTSGDTLTIAFDYCKYKQVDSHITIDYVGEYIVPSLSTQRQFPVGCHNKTLPLVIPGSTPTGNYYILMTIQYRVSGLRSETYEFKTNTFHIEHIDRAVTP